MQTATCNRTLYMYVVLSLEYTFSCHPNLSLSIHPSIHPFLLYLSLVSSGEDPHFSVLLPTNQLICFTIQGEQGFIFNLVHSPLITINAEFIQDKERSEVTWISRLGIVMNTNSYHGNNKTTLRFEASGKILYVNEKNQFLAQDLSKVTFAHGKVMISTVSRSEKSSNNTSIHIHVVELGFSFSVEYIQDHLDILYYSIPVATTTSSYLEMITKHSGNSKTGNTFERIQTKVGVTSNCIYHGLIGQFFCPGHSVDEVRKLLLFPTVEQEPVPVMRRPVWSFMERESGSPNSLCWMTMNSGYQGEGLIEGHYLDYVMSELLSTSTMRHRSSRSKKL